VESKRRMIILFMFFCKLTNIMHSVVLVWNCASALCANTVYHDPNSDSEIFKDVQTIECQLNEWNRFRRAELTKGI
jgi:hypothetical protein